MIQIFAAFMIATLAFTLRGADSKIPHYTLKDTSAHFSDEYVVSKVAFDRALLEKKTEIAGFQQRHYFRDLGFDIGLLSFELEPNADNAPSNSGKQFCARIRQVCYAGSSVHFRTEEAALQHLATLAQS